MLCYIILYTYTDWAKVPVDEYTKHRVYFGLLFVNYCIIFHTNNCKPTFALPYIIHNYICNYIYIYIYTYSRM